MSSLTEDMMTYVLDAEISQEACDALKETLGSSNSTRQAQLLLTLRDLSLEGKTMIEFLKEAKRIRDQLAGAGMILGKPEFNASVFRALSSEYYPIMVVLSAKTQHADFNELSGQFLSHKILLKTNK